MSFYAKGQKDILNVLYGNQYDSIIEGASKFIEKKILPLAEKVDKEKMPIKENLEKLASLDMLVSSCKEVYEELASPYPVHIGILEMVSKACASTGVAMAVHNTCCEAIITYGSKEQKEKYLPDFVTKGKICSICLTEPNSGSNVFKEMLTTAKKDSDGYVIKGSKAYITSAGMSVAYIVLANLEGKPTFFMVDADNPGLKVDKQLDKECVRGSPTADVILDDCKVSKDALLGEEGKGAKYTIELLNKGRVGIATLAVGIAQATLEKSLHYAVERKLKDGSSIADFQLIQKKIADMATSIDAARLLTYHAAACEKNNSFSRLANEAKLLASKTALNCALEAKFIHAAHGCILESNVERHLRDAWLTLIGEGTPEMLEQAIAKLVLKDYQSNPGISFW